MKVFLIIILTIFSSFSYAQKKGDKVFASCVCWDDDQYESVFSQELANADIWTIVRKPSDADFIINIFAWWRPQVAGYVYESYAIIFDKKEDFIWKSDIYLGHQTVFNGYDSRKASIKKLIQDGLDKEFVKLKNFHKKQINILGEGIIPEKEYIKADDYLIQGLEYFNKYNYKKAIQSFSYGIKINPHNALLYKYRALSLFHTSKYKDARNDIIVAMKIDPLSVQNDTIYYGIMIEKNNKFMRTMNSINVITSSINNLALALISVGVSYDSSSSGTSESSMNNAKINSSSKSKRICTFCHGTGQNPAKERPAFYNYNDEDYSGSLCEICGSRTNHYHKSCPSCLGKGYK